MFFIDLKKLKIVKDYRPATWEFDVSLPIDVPALEVKHAVQNAIQELKRQFQDTPLAIDYVFNIMKPVEVDDEEEFYSLVNVFLLAFTEYFCLDQGRPRERRLDVPDTLKSSVNCSRSLLKKMINAQTIRDIFNVTINWNDLHFTLVDGKDEEDAIETNFIHDLDELKTKETEEKYDA